MFRLGRTKKAGILDSALLALNGVFCARHKEKPERFVGKIQSCSCWLAAKNGVNAAS